MDEERFFLTPEDEQSPPVYYGCQVRPLINAGEYFGALAKDLFRLGRYGGPGRRLAGPSAPPGYAQAGTPGSHGFLYIAGYVVNLAYPGDPLTIPGPKGPVRLLDILIEKARQGVDVRVLAWIPWPLALANRIDIRPESADSMRTIRLLRQEPALQHKVCLNLVSHPAGSAHAKLVVMGKNGSGQDWAVGYTGGIDFSPDRALPDWLDVQARVEGPAVQEMYDFFGQMWNQNLVYAGMMDDANINSTVNDSFSASGNGSSAEAERTNGEHDHSPARRLFGLRLPRARHPNKFTGRAGTVEGVVEGTPPVEPCHLPDEARGDHLVQPLLTLPAFKYALSPLLPRIRVAPLQFAPQGKFEVRAALRKAILAAERYIYIEDQYLWSMEVMRWINKVVRRQPELQVILVTGVSDQLGDRLDVYRNLAVSEELLADLNEGQRAQIGVYQHRLNIHAKTTLIDDRWTLIGSANIARRSLYTDIEHSIAVIDPTGEFTRQYRARLWGSRLGLPKDQQAALKDLSCAIQIWQERWNGSCLTRLGESWGITPASIYPLRRVDRNLPDSGEIDEEWFRMIEDPDSRRPWYFPIRREYPTYYR